MSRQDRAYLGMVITFVLVAVLSEVNRQIGAGHIVFPAGFEWLAPVLGAGLAALVAALSPSVRHSTTERRGDIPRPPGIK